MSVSGIQGQLLEVTVVGCTKLKDTEWVSRQDPYVCLEYGSNKVRTRTCTDGGRNPTFQEKFIFTLIEGLRELNIVVWNSNTLTYDDFIGSGKIPLDKVLSEGFDDCTWPLQTKTGRAAGEARLIMHYANAKKVARPSAPLHMASGPHVSVYTAQPPPHVSAYSAPTPQVSAHSALPPAYGASYPPPPTAYSTSTPHPSYPANQAYTPPPTAYTTSSPHPTYLANQVHPPSAYPPEPVAYPPPPYPPPSAYPPSPYPPPPQGSQFYPPRHYPGHYPPPY
ncbi:hypothetical protein K2173_002341 [Erythroxylum novogranatense]|uniref:C2 domain-containing protein n=1 Tax=Erythroxylum novogranatense TaxID=1862640 RepID=A0AAV8TBD0_9ROSI|nr:hypothetical protein K2173_002341 [Erythroxylum novogranatense]